VQYQKPYNTFFPAADWDRLMMATEVVIPTMTVDGKASQMILM